MTTSAIPTDLTLRIERRSAELQQQLDASRVSSTTVASLLDESRALDQRAAEVEHRLRGLRDFATHLAEFDDIADDERWKTFLEFTARPTLCSELLAIRAPTRTHEQKQIVENLTFSIRLIDKGLGYSTIGMIVDLTSLRLGDLMAAAGYEIRGDGLRGPRGWRGDLPTVSKRIADRSAQRDKLINALEDALMDDATRAAREAEINAYRATLATMTIQRNDDGRSLEAFTQDGDPLERSSMTDAQRAAFDWFVKVAS